MKKIFATIIAAAMTASAFAATAELTATGAKITLDSITTEIIIYSPKAVRVIKYVGDERPALKPLKLAGVPAEAKEQAIVAETGHNKVMVGTGAMKAALNEKDGNVSFWSRGDTLIMAEQHRTGVLKAANRKGLREVAQDFQMGRAKVENLYCPALKEGKRVNLKGKRVAIGNKKGGLPTAHLATEKGFEVIWLSGGGELNATERTDKKKQGDITITSPSARHIDYLFVIE